MNRTVNQLNSRRIGGFTILEVLIALTASLLLMLGLARAYKLLGDKITEQQSELDLSSRLRDVAIRLRDELRRATFSFSPPAKEGSGEGYFVYHEGPFTDTTAILGSVPNPTPIGIDYFKDSQYGDIDDYLAFTTRAARGAPYVGFLPQGVLDAHRVMNGQMGPAGSTERNNYNNLIASSTTTFYSDKAEIAYWLSPRWERNADGTLLYESATADGSGNFSLHPVYRDRNEDLLPDQMNLHRRVLLIRPDLNMTPAQMNNFNGGALPSPLPTNWNVPTIPYLHLASGSLRIDPLSDLIGNNQSAFPNATFMNAPGLWVNPGQTAAQVTASPHWLTGVARLQQIMDLSISRVTDNWSAPATGPTNPPPTFGMPTSLIQANSLAQLSRPENRFAHVRIPHQVISGTQGSSMPQLALCPPHPYIAARTFTPPDLVDPNDPLRTPPFTPTTFPTQGTATQTPPGGTKYFNSYGRFTMKTFLRPEFNLADRVSDIGAGGTSSTRVNRGGSDVIAVDVVGFNIQIFDPSVPQFVWTGPDALPGVANFDDNGNGFDDDVAELGWPGTDDEPVSVNDPRIDEVLVNNGSRTPTDWFVSTAVTPFAVVDRGGFVDLGYMRLAGGPMRGLVQFDESGTLLPNANLAEFASNFSGYSGNASVSAGNPGTPVTSTFPSSWEQSGRFILSTTGGSGTLSSFYQPVYDSWTDGYKNDPFDQEGALFGGVSGEPFALEVGGITPGMPAYLESRTAQNNAGTVSQQQRNVVSRRWTSFDGAASNEGSFVDTNAGEEQTTPQFADLPIPVTAPVREPLRAIKISIRINDFPAETIRQQTVIQEF